MQEQGSLSINSENLFPIIKKWLYSDQDIFIRELVSNAVDAIVKFRKMVSMGDAEASEDEQYAVHVTIDAEAETITVSDNGIGMTADEVRKYINQVAFSGAAEFLEKYKNATEDPIIGHFGLGFYSAFMVASQIQINTLSYQEGAEPVLWTSDGESGYEMTEGTRTSRGTDIILHVNEDGRKYLTTWELRTILQKYCAFMPVEIYLENPAEEAKNREEAAKNRKEGDPEPEAPVPKPINEIHPLWTRNANELKDEDYKAFYRDVFMDYREPLFWIHLNMDYPFRLKGILYFPKLGNEFESAEGQVKLYCNQVFVADNVKEVIPEFLLLLKGAIDCPDIPLNVSRSFLQNDGYVRKISDYITRKVADKLKSLYNGEREQYEKYWDDIHPFIKYGCLRNEKFYDRVKDCILYKSAVSDHFVTMSEYLEAAKETHENKVFYTTDPRRQAQYITALSHQQIDVVILPTTIDVPFISLIESKQEGVRFLRVDADLSQALKDSEITVDESLQSKAEALFREALGKEDLKVRLENLKDTGVSVLLEQSEESRRMHDMMRMYSGVGMNWGDMPADETLVVNAASPVVARLLAAESTDLSKKVVSELYDLARLSSRPFEASELGAFIARSQDLLQALLSD
ncbi:MAG: molecular chaperone HtpG [Firmicutes bacterium]|nr:molecular chaperone HtpG [Bacillota bacterium]